MSANDGGALFVTLGIRSLYLWVAKVFNPAAGLVHAGCPSTDNSSRVHKPSIVVSKIIRSHISIEEDGENTTAFWGSNSSSVFVLTSRGYVHVYSVQHGAVKSFNLQFQTEHHYGRAVGEGKNLSSLVLRYKTTITVKGNVISGFCTENEEIFLATDGEHPMLYTLSMQENEYHLINSTSVDKLMTDITDMSSKSTTVATPLAIVKIVAPPGLRVFCFLLSNGQVIVTYRSELSQGDDESLYTSSTTSIISEVSWTGIRIPICDASGEQDFAADIAVNERFDYLVVVSRSFLVTTYSLSLSLNDNEEQSKPLVGLTLSHSFTLPHTISHTIYRISLKLTGDGFAMAIGVTNIGLFVFSIYGRQLLCMTKDAFKENLSESLQNEEVLQDNCVYGVSDLFWTPGCYELVLLPSQTTLANAHELEVIPFLKSPLITNCSQDNVRNPYLLSYEYVLFRSSKFVPESEDLSDHLLKWSSIKISAVSRDGRLLVVAGHRGLAHYSFQSGHWKMFASRAQEQSFVCLGLAWYQHICIAAIQYVGTGICKISCFARDNNLDLALSLCDKKVTGTPLVMNLLDSRLYLYTYRNTLTIYSISTETKFEIQMLYALGCQQFVTNPESVHGVTVISLLSDVGQTKYSELPVLVSKGRVLCCEVKENNAQVYKLTDQVEYCFSVDHTHGPLNNALWAVTGDACLLFPNLITKESVDDPDHPWSCDITRRTSNNDCIRTAVDFLPLSVSMRQGVVFGVMPETLFKKAFGLAHFGLETKKLLFLHNVFEDLIRKGLVSLAAEFANQHVHEGSLVHAQELLLHNVWEKECDTSAGYGPGAILPAVVQFLRIFPSFLEVIVNCTRKTELSLWDYLFSIVGSPRALFEECIVRGKLRTATSYLVVLHNIESHVVSGKESLRLLEEVLESDDYELCLELVRFLSSIGGSGTGTRLWETLQNSNKENATTHISRSSSTQLLLPAAGSVGPQYHLEILVSRHARSLLNQYRIRAFHHLVKAIGFPIATWIKKERNRSARIWDFLKALHMTHKEFNLAYPQDLPLVQIEDKKLKWRINRRHTISVPTLDVHEDDTSNIMGERMCTESNEYLPDLDRIGQLPKIYVNSEFAELGHVSVNASQSEPKFLSSKRRTMSMLVENHNGLVKLQIEERIEIRELSELMQVGDCYGWYYLLAAMLFDIQQISETIMSKQESIPMWQSAREALLASKSQGYTMLVEAIDDIVGSHTSGREAQTT